VTDEEGADWVVHEERRCPACGHTDVVRAEYMGGDGHAWCGSCAEEFWFTDNEEERDEDHR